MRHAAVAGMVALTLVGCAAGQEKDAAEQAVAHFHRLVDQERFAEIYRAAAPDFRATVREAAFVDLMSRVRAFGPVGDTRQTGWRINYDSRGHRVTLNYSTRYGPAEAREEFTYRIENGAPGLVSYDFMADRPLARPAAPATADGTAIARPGGGKQPHAPATGGK